MGGVAACKRESLGAHEIASSLSARFMGWLD